MISIYTSDYKFKNAINIPTWHSGATIFLSIESINLLHENYILLYSKYKLYDYTFKSYIYLISNIMIINRNDKEFLNHKLKHNYSTYSIGAA